MHNITTLAGHIRTASALCTSIQSNYQLAPNPLSRAIRTDTAEQLIHQANFGCNRIVYGDFDLFARTRHSNLRDSSELVG